MNEQQLHEVAVAYAQVKLRAYQEEHKDVPAFFNCFAGSCLFFTRSVYHLVA